jgi:predicted nucleotidyltransferase component of viral defense system
MEPDRSGIYTTENVGGTKVIFPKDLLQSESSGTGFRSDILEKVLHMINVLKQLIRHPFLKGRIVLKGGTALNLFVWDIPRLSVDIDLNYIGSLDCEIMLQERPKIEEALIAVCQREGITRRNNSYPATGGTCRW